MGKRTSKRGISIGKTKNIPPSPKNYLLGSSADTFSSSPDQSHHNIHHHHHINHNQIHIQKKQALNYAILNDDIVEEAALLSSSEGYDAELDDDHMDSQSSNLDVESMNQIINNDYYTVLSNNDQNSVLSESDSLLLTQERNTYFSLPWYKRPSVLMISLLLFLYSYSTGISMSSELQLILKAVCYLNDPSMSNCSSSLVQQQNASVQKWSNFIGSILKILISAKMGILSDIYGRKPLIIWTFTMTGISKLALVFVLTPQYFSIRNYIFTILIDSLGGSLFVLLSFANSYTIDVVNENNRLQSLGKIMGFMFLGLSLGPTTSALLGQLFHIRSRNFLITSAVLYAISLLLIIFLLPESRSNKLKIKSRRNSIKSQKTKKVNPTLIYKLGLSPLIDSFHSLKLLWISRPVNFQRSNQQNVSENTQLLPLTSQNIDLSARINVLLLLFVEILITFCSVGASLSVALYLIYIFDLSQSQLGWFVGAAAGFRALILTIFNPWCQKYLFDIFAHDSVNVDFIDVTSISFAIICELIASILCAFSSKLIIVILYIILSSISSIGSPVIHSALLKYNSSQGKNGEFFGALALIRNLVNLISPWAFLSIYSFGLGIGKPEFIFYAIIVFYSIAAVLMGFLRFPSF